MISLIENTPLIAFGILIAFMFVGDIISKKTNAYIPAILVFVILLLAGSWTGIIPINIIEVPGFTAGWATYIISMYLVDMGSSISLKQLKEQWKTVVVSICTIVVSGLVILTIGRAIFGWDVAAVAAPTVSGGFVAAMTMSNAANALGKTSLAALAVLIYVIHSFPAYILFPTFVKKEGRAVMKKLETTNNTAKQDIGKSEEVYETVRKTKLIDKVPEQYKTAHYYLFNLALFAVVAQIIANWTQGVVPSNIIALLFGIFGAHFGLVEVGAMNKSGSGGYLMFGSMISIFTSLASTNPSEVVASIVPLVGLIAIGLIGIFVGSMVSGKVVGYTTARSIAVGLNALLGFPLNFMMTTEAIKALASNEEEEKVITDDIMPSMLVAGFVSITIGSTIFASIMAGLL